MHVCSLSQCICVTLSRVRWRVFVCKKTTTNEWFNVYLCGVGVVGISVCGCVFTCVCIAYCDLTHTEKETEAKGEIVFLFVLFCFGSVKNKSDCFFVVVFLFCLPSLRGFLNHQHTLAPFYIVFQIIVIVAEKYTKKKKERKIHIGEKTMCVSLEEEMEWSGCSIFLLFEDGLFFKWILFVERMTTREDRKRELIESQNETSIERVRD